MTSMTNTTKSCHYRALSNSPPCSSTQDVGLERDEDIYFQDGNVILIAGATYFRVHQSILAKHSPVFNDLFSIPQPPEQELYEGVPRVDLQDDPGFVRAFLQLIYEPFSGRLNTWLSQPTVQTTSEMVGVFCLALKYQVDTLRNEIIQRLVSAWPQTLEQWDSLEKRRELVRETACIDPGATIRMARVANIRAILPVAYYCLIQSYPRRRSNDADEAEESGRCAPSGDVMVELLDGADLTALSLGREEMAKWVSRRCRASFRTWYCASGGSQRGRVCCQRIHLRWAELLEDVTMRRDVLRVLGEHASWGSGTLGMVLCSACQARFVETVQNMRAELWTALPAIFGLPEGCPASAAVQCTQ